jgi:voltage-gated potassium channel
MKPASSGNPVRRDMPRWQRTLSRIFARPYVELAIGVLIVVSVVLTLVEFCTHSPQSGTASDPRFDTLIGINDGLTWFFIVELTLRFLAAPSKSRFFREFWVDIIAVLPWCRIFRVGRAVRLLRLIRILRLFGFASRAASSFPYVFRRGAVEYLLVCGLLVLTVIFGTGAILYFEAGQSEPGDKVDEAFWFSMYSLFAGEPIPGPPKTIGGRIVAVVIMFMGLTIFAMFTGTVSAFMVERLRTEGRVVETEYLSDHLIICGWNHKAEIIIEEFRAAHANDDLAIVVIAQFPEQRPVLAPALQSRVQFLDDDFTRITALRQAGIDRAVTCVILADATGGRSEQDTDARTILAALTVEKLNPEVYTCAELHNRLYGAHLETGHVNDYVVAGEHSAFLLAQAAMNRGLMEVFSELLTYRRGNQFYRLTLPDSWIGKSFLDAMMELKRDNGATLVAVCTADGPIQINPNEYEFAAGDDVVVIAEHVPSL